MVIRTHPLPDGVRVSAEQPKSFCHNLQTEKLHTGDRVGGWSFWEQITRQKSRHSEALDLEPHAVAAGEGP